MMRRDARAVEGARLEIVCSDKIGTEGSNPSLSAMYHMGYMAGHTESVGSELTETNVKSRLLRTPNLKLKTLIYGERYRSGHNGADSKSAVRLTADRGFESHPLRQPTPRLRLASHPI